MIYLSRAVAGFQAALDLHRRAVAAFLLSLALGAGLWLAPATPAMAHPHSWVDLSVTLETDDQGRVTALRQVWRLDPFYSLVLLEEARAAEDGQDAALDRLGGDMLVNLAPRDFFTEAEVDGQALAFAAVSEATVMARDERVVLHFRLPLAEPQDLAGSTLEYRVFDPSYYVEVVHEADDEGPLAQALSVPDACQASIIVADPDPEKVMAAAQLDVDDSAPQGLGRFFAETGRGSC